MTIEISSEELQGFLKTSTLAIAILRNIFHVFSATGTAYTYLEMVYPCTF